MKLFTRRSELLTKEEIDAENLAAYGTVNPYPNNAEMQEYIDRLDYFREAVIAKALGMDFKEVRLNGNGGLYKRYYDRIPMVSAQELLKLTEQRKNNPNRWIVSHIWGYEQTNVEIAEWVGSFNGLQVFINDHQIFLSRPVKKSYYEYPQVRQSSCQTYDLNPKSYGECYSFFAAHDDPHNGYYR
ncbi:MAG: hypothetical protein FWD58_06220 [Firmicutes bacterium]|nr:hypothetical protein [Bacillota bacterium]